MKTVFKRDFQRSQHSFPLYIIKLLFVNQYSWLFTFRLSNYLFCNSNIILKSIGIPFVLINKLIATTLGLYIPFNTKIGKGFSIKHPVSIVINSRSIIGENCTIFQDVTIGRSFGDSAGTPTIGDNVVIFSGAKIIGKCKIGNNAIIGANSVVTKDVPENCIVGGIPAKILSINSSKILLCKKNKDYLYFGQIV